MTIRFDLDNKDLDAVAAAQKHFAEHGPEQLYKKTTALVRKINKQLAEARPPRVERRVKS